MKRIFSLLALSLLLVSCDYLEALNPEPKMTFGIDINQAVTVTEEGGIISIPIESNGSWLATAMGTSGVAFISLITSKGEKGSSTLEFNVKPNLLTQNRYGTISLSCENKKGIQTYIIGIAQLGAEAFAMILDWDEPVIPAEGGSLTMKVLTNCAWGFMANDADVTVVEMKAPSSLSMTDPDTYELTLAIAKNPGTEPRTFQLNFTDRMKGNTIIATYTFSQAG